VSNTNYWVTTTAEGAARRRDYGGPPAYTEQTLVRYWPNIDRTEASTLLAALWSVTNGIVTNPKADGSSYNGVYRVTNVASEEQPDGGVTLVQTLKLGYQTDTDNADALLRSFEGPPQLTEPTLIRYWRNVPRTNSNASLDVQTLVETLWAVDSYDAPQADGKAYTGTFRNARVWVEEQSDGFVRIVQELKKGWVKSEESLPTAIDVERIKELITAFGMDNESWEETTIKRYRGIDPDYAETLADTAVSLEMTRDNDDESGNIKTEIVRDKDGSCSIYVVNKVRDWQNPTSNDLYDIEMLDATSSRPMLQKVLVWDKLAHDAAEDILKDGQISSYVKSSDVSGWTLFRLHRTSNGAEDGTFRVKAYYGIWGYSGAGGQDDWELTGLQRIYPEKQHENNNADHYRWRLITETFNLLLTSNGSNAVSATTGSKCGGWIRHVGNGHWLIKEVTAISVGSWNSTAYDPGA